MIRRLSALAPTVASTVAVALMIVLLVAGTDPGKGTTQFWLSLNTSKIGQDLVQLSPAQPNGDNPLDAITGALDDLLGGLIGDITNGINQGIEDIQGQIVGNLTKALGVKDTYMLFLTKICEGDFVNPDNPNSDVTVTQCVSYDDKGRGLRNIANSIPSSFVVGITNITVPLVSALGSTINSVVSLATFGANAIFALLMISVVSIGITMIGSVISLILGFRAPLVVINMGFAMLGTTTILLFAAVSTGIIVGGSSAINGLGTAFGLETKQGRSFLVIAWIAAGFSIITNTYWFALWFVETRKSAFTRRLRTADEIGNWRGIFRQTWRNLRVNRGEKSGKSESQ